MILCVLLILICQLIVYIFHFFCFFKQKTAYEMRISDWSSDVCSSDLPGEMRQFPHRDHDMWQGEKGNHEYLVNVIWPLTSFTRENGATQIYPGSHAPKGMARAETGEQIGRASGRERVCT